MSIAGIQSNRGDGYQTLIAFDWALSMLSSPDYAWIEVDSVQWQVDDVVIGRTNGTLICCQCKKNQPRFSNWSITELAEELSKAFRVLAKDPSAEVRFYSSSPFGKLAALKNYSCSFTDEAAYQAQIGQGHRETDEELRALLLSKGSTLSTLEFLNRTLFENTPSLERLHEKARESLFLKVSNHAAVFDALWTRLDFLGLRIPNQHKLSATQHRLQRADLVALLAQNGALLAPPINLATVQTSFRTTSQVGRSWRRDIAGHRLVNTALSSILAAIDRKATSVLLTGGPGAGKTCVMLDLQEELERRAQSGDSVIPLFIQTREFADSLTAQERQSQGLSEHWVEEVARASECSHVVVVIDSLDVLSIAREHQALVYFLGRIERLRHLPNVTVVTACREFDRNYDRRIAQMDWSDFVTCPPLDWDRDILPLLTQLDIDPARIDTLTRSLITSHRELTLFLDVARRSGGFNVISGRDLASRYIDAIVTNDPTLGQDALRAIEAMAEEMLERRSLGIDRQRFRANDETLRRLLSQKVLQETDDRKLTFGHQTLLDVLVVSDALRKGLTLHEFISNCPPVPFVRPSIRSFVTHLALGNRREFRKQLRTVLVSSNAFHIRRLVAEVFAESTPVADDWPLIRDLRTVEPGIFQSIYLRAEGSPWYDFWINHLVPLLIAEQDTQGLLTHVNMVSKWLEDNPEDVLRFWTGTLSLDWIDPKEVAWRLEYSLRKFPAKQAALFAPLLLRLLEFDQMREPGFIGTGLARCVTAGVMDDIVLWRFVTNNLTERDILSYRFDGKLRCQPHLFGGKSEDFFPGRMKSSTTLLNLAIADIERWSQTRNGETTSKRPSLRDGFLGLTSHRLDHSQVDRHPVDSENLLMDAVESAIANHAVNRSLWWTTHREQLAHSTEGALRYFVIKACTACTDENLDVIGHLLLDKEALESGVSFELGTLLHVAFIHLPPSVQDEILVLLQELHDDYLTDPDGRRWALRYRAQYLGLIPACFRTPSVQQVLDECSSHDWPWVRTPSIGPRGGMIQAPFSYEVFLSSEDAAILRLLAHYVGRTRNRGFDAEFLVGGESEVGWQLSEAASRHPMRFLRLLETNWSTISDRFCANILEGTATYLACNYGDLQKSPQWSPLETPDPIALARNVLAELERHPQCWFGSRAAAKVIEGCAHVLKDPEDLERLTFFCAVYLPAPAEDVVVGNDPDLLSNGINMKQGIVATALMIMANTVFASRVRCPAMLIPMLHLAAGHHHPAVRSMVLRRLPYLQSLNPELGWRLFEISVSNETPGLWKIAEPCLYYAYRQNFQLVEPWLARLRTLEVPDAKKCLGRISALATFEGHLDLSTELARLATLDSPDAWSGAVSVWSHPENFSNQKSLCLAGLQTALSAENRHASHVVSRLRNLIFDDASPSIFPKDLIRRYFELQAHQENHNDRVDLHGVGKWLNAVSIQDTGYALEIAEIFLDIASRISQQHFDHESNWPQLLTRLFSQAEEIEDIDSGAMLIRVVALQDSLLSIGVNGINDWLDAAERSMES